MGGKKAKTRFGARWYPEMGFEGNGQVVCGSFSHSPLRQADQMEVQ